MEDSWVGKNCKMKQAVDDEETAGADIISTLPKELICHILSFLSIKEAVGTCVLSTQWKYLWTTLAHFEFSDTMIKTRKKVKRDFINFINRVLLFNGKADIESFTLSFESCKHDASLVSSWISFVIKRNARRIKIKLRQNGDPVFIPSYSLFNSRCLTELILDMECTLTLSASQTFSALNVLCLSNVSLSNDASTSTQVLKLTLPVLRAFECEKCTWCDIKTLKINSPMLESFTLGDSEYILDGFLIADAEVEVCSQHLITFSCAGYHFEKFTLANSRSICEAFIKITDGDTPSLGLKLVSLLKQLDGAEHLELYGDDLFELLAEAKSAVPFPSFGKLKRLEVDSEISDSETFLELLHSSPYLALFSFGKVGVHFGNLLQSSAKVPDCFVSSLDEIEFKVFSGDQEDLSLAEYMIKRCKALKRMFIIPTSELHSSPDYYESVKEFLLNCLKERSDLVQIRYSSPAPTPLEVA